MTSFFKIIALSLALAAGASAAQARPVLNDLPRTEASITLHGIFDAQ